MGGISRVLYLIITIQTSYSFKQLIVSQRMEFNVRWIILFTVRTIYKMKKRQNKCVSKDIGAMVYSSIHMLIIDKSSTYLLSL